MSKPIFIARPPSTYTKEKAADIYPRMVELLKDYHVMIFSNEINKWDFQLFSDKEIEPIELEKLKGLINQ